MGLRKWLKKFIKDEFKDIYVGTINVNGVELDPRLFTDNEFHEYRAKFMLYDSTGNGSSYTERVVAKSVIIVDMYLKGKYHDDIEIMAVEDIGKITVID